MASILIVEDEKPINQLIAKNLTLVGYDCTQVYDGRAAIDACATEQFDLIILDVMLPELSGFEVMEQVSGIPVIFVTAKNGLSDRLNGLRLGADDYIVKPFEMLELIARVEAVLRRTSAGEEIITFDDIKVDIRSKRVCKAGELVSLTPKEYSLLEALIRNRNLALSREKLISLAWSYDYDGDIRTVDVHIQQLRNKLGLKERIKTVYKLGYRLEI